MLHTSIYPAVVPWLRSTHTSRVTTFLFVENSCNVHRNIEINILEYNILVYHVVATLLLRYGILKFPVISVVQMKARPKNHNVTMDNLLGIVHVPNKVPPIPPVFLNMTAINADTLLNPLAGRATDIKEIIGTQRHEFNPRERMFFLRKINNYSVSN